MDALAIAARFEAARAERLAKEWHGSQPHNPNPYDLSDCRRYQVVRILGWAVRERPDADAMATIENGREAEPVMIRQLQAEGWEVVETQSPFEIRQPVNGTPRRILSGRIDGKLRYDGRLLPFDTKDTSEWTLARIETERDLLSSMWTRKWWRQLQVYLLGENTDLGFLILGFRGQRKVIPVTLDYTAAEELLQLCIWAVALVDELERERVDATTLDEALRGRGVPYHSDYSVCRSCPFRNRACFPPEPSPGSAQVKPELAALVERYVATKPAAAEYERVRKAIAAQTEGFQSTIVGDYVIDGEVKTRAMKAQPARPAYVSEYWSFGVRRVGESGAAEGS